MQVTRGTTPRRDADRLVRLAEADSFAPLRWLDRIGDAVSSRHRSRALLESLSSCPSPLEVRHGDDTSGVLVWRAVPDLAEHFGVPVHEVVALLVDPGAERRVVVDELLGALKSELAGGQGFVMLRIEADDRAAMAGATAAGFRLCETSLTFVNDLERRQLNPPYDPTGMRIHRFSDGPVPDRLQAVFRSAPTRLVDDHYHADHRLDDERCDALYDRVRDRVIRGVGADVVVYHEADGQVTGFGTFRRAVELEPFGVALLDRSIGFQFPGAPAGQSNASAAFMCNEVLLDNRFCEWTTQATNFRMVNMLGGHRSVRLVRSSHVLHGWIDEW